MKYRSEIDGLRAVAVIPVILFHAGFDLFGGGYIGVDVFFVISGYLITSILIADLIRDKFSISRFYERRARRILPALFVVMVACMPFAWLWMLPSQLTDFAQSVTAVVFFVSNFLFWMEDGYFAASAELKPLLHTWSLAVEEQFYVLFPLFLLFVWKFGQRRVFWIIVVVAIFSLLLSDWGSRNAPSANFYLAPTRAWELAVGSICALLLNGRAQRESNGLSVLGLALILFSIFAFDHDTPFPGIFALVPVLGTALIILFATPNTTVGRLLSLRIFVGIGLISYSAYLWHQPLFAFARLRSLAEPSHFLMGVLATCSLLLAWVTWRFVEQPFRKGPRPLLPTRRSVFVASGVAGAALAAVGLAGHAGLATQYRYTTDELALVETAAWSPMRARCHYGRDSDFAPEESCVFFGDEPSIAVYGNSHGVELAYGLAGHLRPSGQLVQQFTVSGCPASFGRNTDAYCDDFYQSRLDYLHGNENIRHVLLTYRTDMNGPSAARSVVELANALDEAGKRVIIVLQAPTLPSDISSYILNALHTKQADVSSKMREVWKGQNQHMYAELATLNDNVDVVDLADAFCSDDRCFAVRGGEALFFDDHHMSNSGAALAARLIASHLGESARSIADDDVRKTRVSLDNPPD